MKKKEPPKFRQFNGWNVHDGVRGYCRACGRLIDFKDPCYWKEVKNGKVNGVPYVRTAISCLKCLEKDSVKSEQN